MTKDDVKNIFKVTDTISLPSGAEVDVETFALLFSDVSSSVTYQELILVDAERMGYKDFFDKCRDEGILN